MSRPVRHLSTRGAAAALTAVLVGAAALLLSGCGSGRVPVPSLSTPATPTGFVNAPYPADGVSLSVPRNWSVTAEKAPMVAVISSGSAVISLWRYPSGHPAVTGTPQLESALHALRTAALIQDPTLKVQNSGLSSVDGAGAVIIDGLEQIAGKLRRVRTEHVYVAGAELVLDAYAPVALFPSVDHAVFSPVRKSLALLNHGQPTATATTAASTATATTATAGGSA